MRLKTLTIRNYRCFREQQISLDRYSCFVGPNGCGKSTVLMALNVFFRNTQAPTDVVNLQEEDFHQRNTSEPIEITCVFGDLSDAAKEDFKAYVRQGELTITARAKWNPDSARGEVLQYGSRRVMKEFAPYFEAEAQGAKAAHLKEVYAGLREAYTDLPSATTKDAMRGALREYEEGHPDLCEEVESDNQFYGWSRGANLLARYVQWVYLPAVKDPTEEQDEQRNSALGILLQRTIRSQVDFDDALAGLRQRASQEYQDLLDTRNNVLASVGAKIQDQLRNWAHPGARVELTWHFDDRKSVTVAEPYARVKVGEGDFLGEIVRSGHGMQRSFLVSLLQVLATEGEQERPTLLLGFEEPELYQHPPQSKHLAALLERLSQEDTQVVITTHSPYFVSSRGYEDIRLVRAGTGTAGSTVSRFTYEQLAERLAQALDSAPQRPTELMAAVEQIMQPSQTELFFARVPVLVEGPEDVAFLATFLQRDGRWTEFRRLGCHFVVCNGKTNMSRPLVIAEGLELPTFAVFDGDCDQTDQQKIAEQRRDNGCLLNLLGSEEDPIQGVTLVRDRFVMWRTRILDETRAEIGAEQWDAAEADARETYKLETGVRRKNPVLISATLERLLESGTDFPTLSSAVAAILRFARVSTGEPVDG